MTGNPRTYSLTQVKAYFCSVFQDFARYALTFRENISLGDTAALETGPIPEERLDKADRAGRPHPGG